jgi:hypothetical protein
VTNIRAIYFSNIRPQHPQVLLAAGVTWGLNEPWMDRCGFRAWLKQLKGQFLDDYYVFIITKSQAAMWEATLEHYNLRPYVHYSLPEYVYNGYQVGNKNIKIFSYKDSPPKLKYYILKFPENYSCQ